MPSLASLAVEERCLEFSLEGQVVLKGNFRSGLTGTLDVANGLDGLVGQGELAAPVENVPAEIIGVALPDVVDEVAGVGVLEGHQFAGDHHFEGLGLPDEAGQASGATGSCEHAEVDLGKTDLSGVLAGDADVGRHGDFKSTTNGVSVDGTDDEFGGLLEARQGLVGRKGQKLYLKPGLTLFSIWMEAPAEKKEAPFPVKTMQVTLSSKRARTMASSMSRIMPCV